MVSGEPVCVCVCVVSHGSAPVIVITYLVIAASL